MPTTQQSRRALPSGTSPVPRPQPPNMPMPQNNVRTGATLASLPGLGSGADATQNQFTAPGQLQRRLLVPQ